ncbi:hypothetical protein [Nonomuraea dietziae]|uniref:hypothetical protein n=1 Tax=Nonomuraea dietziae TaxID=65515 RepID=UPI00340F6A6F
METDDSRPTPAEAAAALAAAQQTRAAGTLAVGRTACHAHVAALRAIVGSVNIDPSIPP